jgi:hypothetical protein
VRRAAHIDENQPEIVKHLRANDWSVHVASAIGQGFPDLICARMEFTALLEVKNPAKPKGDQALTPPQVEFHKSWPGVKLIAFTPHDALTKLNAALIRSGACKREDLR